MATKVVDSPEKFDPETESILAYLERIEIYFAANEIKEEKKVPVFLNAIGKQTYGVLRNLLAPAKPSEKTMEELTKALKSHFEPKKVVIAKRFHFYRRNQGSGETVADYVAELRKLATHCDFKENLEEAIRDRLVCGLRREATQRRLLLEADLSLEKAIELAKSFDHREIPLLQEESRVGRDRCRLCSRVAKIGYTL